MSFIARFVLAVIKGLGGPDLQALVDDLPGQLGVRVGKILGDAIRFNRSLTPQEEAQVERLILQNGNGNNDLLVAVVKRLLMSPGATRDVPTRSGSIIGLYLEVLNFIFGCQAAAHTSIVLGGFFHSEDCLSYWVWDESTSSRFEKHPTLELINPYPHEIHLHVDPPVTEQRVRELNLEIRTGGGRLERIGGHKFSQVATIHEFDLKLGDRLFEKKGLPIPIGAPGTARMLTTLPLALEAQSLPYNLVRRGIDEGLRAIRESSS